MDKSLCEIQNEAMTEINKLTGDVIMKLSEIWSRLYEPTSCKENIRILTKHVDTFYKEILAETAEKEDQILIDIKSLQEEGKYLERLLKVEVPLQLDESVPLFTAKFKLNESLHDLRKLLQQRKQQIYELLLEQEKLCEDLNEPHIKLVDDPLPTEDELQNFRLYLDSLHKEKINRANEVRRLRCEIMKLLKDLEIFNLPEEEKIILYDTDLPLTRDNILKLKKIYDFYFEQMEDMKQRIDIMKEKIEKLWNDLNISDFHKKFEKYMNIYTQTTYNTFYVEFEQCKKQKRENVKMLIEKIRLQILELWEKCLKSDIERRRFANYTNDCYTEDLLDLHEMELEDLKTFYEDNKKIFQLFEERKQLWERMIALEAQTSDSSRLNNRGGKLLLEEKERKMVVTKLPKIEEKLKGLVHEFEKTNKRKFTVFGEDIINVMERDWEKRHEEKEKMMSARKNVVLPRTPLSAKNHQITMSSMNKLVSMRNISSVPYKRPLTTEDRDLNNPSAKRKLLTIDTLVKIQSPKLLTTSRIKLSTQQKKKRVIATTINRRSGRYSNSGKRRRRSKKNSPKIVISDTSNSTSYDIFQQCIDNNPSSRSSILLKDTNTDTAATRLAKHERTTKVESRLPTPKKPVRNILTSKIVSPVAGPSGVNRKLITKDVPILF